MEEFQLKEEIVYYYEKTYRSQRLLWELLGNAYRTIRSVYIFKHFDEYCQQLSSDLGKGKNEIYWNASYNEKLIDYIKICTAFETYNKAYLLKNGIVVHTINGKFNKQLSNKQSKGFPVTTQEFLENNYTSLDWTNKTATLYGLYPQLNTISYSQTLNSEYQQIIKFDDQFLFELKKINDKRNKLHFFTDFKGAFSVYDHIKQWRFIKETAISVIENEYHNTNKELDNY